MTFLPEPEPRPVWCPIISVDDHALEPPDTFQARVPSRMHDAAPKVVYEGDVPFWEVDGVGYPINVINGAVGRPMAEWDGAPQRYEEFRAGVSDPQARIRDMDLNGVWASLLFPSITFGFAGRSFAAMKDQEVGLASVRAWNDWMLEEICEPFPERFIPCQLPWLSDPQIAAFEIERNAERGYRAVSFSENPQAIGFESIYSSAWDPFFAACRDTGTVVNLHVGSSGNVHRPSSQSPVEVSTALFPVNGIVASVDWIFAKVPLRAPGIKIALSEAGLSWVPMVMERLSRAHRQMEASIAWRPEDGDPVEHFLESFYFTSIEDPSGFRLLDVVGEDHVMVEVDYPHRDSSWPDTQALLKRDLTHLAPATVRKVCFENAARVYRHPEPPADLYANSEHGQAQRGTIAG
jgi:predicted TIM-barrel fold metal-dependent hydrolase